MPSPLGKVSPKVTEEVRTFAKQKCIAEGDLYGNTQGIRPLPTSLRSATFPGGEGIWSFAQRQTAIDRAVQWGDISYPISERRKHSGYTMDIRSVGIISKCRSSVIPQGPHHRCRINPPVCRTIPAAMPPAFPADTLQWRRSESMPLKSLHTTPCSAPVRWCLFACL